MARRKAKREEEVQSGSIVAMIDVVFQLIIFFVCTVSMQEKPSSDRIVLPLAPNGAPLVTKLPNEFRVNVDKNGAFGLTGTYVSEAMLAEMLKKTMIQTGAGVDLPVVIRADVDTKHRAVKKVMDACTQAGIWKIRFVAIQKAVSK
ncbi:MAG: biopolymer transporter ExbD [bacterium]